MKSKLHDRTMEQLQEQYVIEKELANKLRLASREERRSLYSSVYDELFRRVPHHPQLTRQSSPKDSQVYVVSQIKALKPFLDKEYTFLEVGPGDCALSLEMTKLVAQVYAVDVSNEITKNLSSPQNFKLVLSDGSSVPVPQNSVNLIYSNQLMEHIHPDDAIEQLQNLYNALAPGGIYFCVTPNRLNGPHDISRYFDTIATGFHLKEYTVSELSALFKKAGFSKIMVRVGARGWHINMPIFLSVLSEKLLLLLPYKIRKLIASSLPARKLLGICLIGVKNI